MAPPHTRVCGWRHITCKATFLACVIELGETGSSHKSAHCDDTTGNHPNHFLLGLRAPSIPHRADRAGKDTGEQAGQEGKGARVPGGGGISAGQGGRGREARNFDLGPS